MNVQRFVVEFEVEEFVPGPDFCESSGDTGDGLSGGRGKAGSLFVQIDELFAGGFLETVFSSDLPAENPGCKREREGGSQDNKELEWFREAGEFKRGGQFGGMKAGECGECEWVYGDGEVVEESEVAEVVSADGESMESVDEDDPGFGVSSDTKEVDQPSLHGWAPKWLLMLISIGTNLAKAFARWLMRCLTVELSCPKVR